MTAPDPPGWRVRRRWMPRLGGDTLHARARRRVRRTRSRLKRSRDLDLGGMDGCGVDALDELVVVVLVLLLLLLVAFVVGPLLLAVLDVLVLVLLALGGLAARVLFRRPWLIDAHHDDGHGLRWRVVGWRASTEKVAEVRQLLAAGIEAPDAEVLPAATAE